MVGKKSDKKVSVSLNCFLKVMKKISIIIVLLSIAILGIILVKSLSKPTPNKRLPIATVEKPNQYRDNNTPLNHFQIHDNITATIFWV